MIREARPEVVHILVPPSLHAAIAMECLERGCDVFLEKPVTVNFAEADALRAAAEKLGRTVGVNHNAVFHPAFQRLVREIKSWRFGGIEHVSACVSVPLRQLSAGQHSHWMFQAPGNIIVEQAPHPLSQIQTLLGDLCSASVKVSGKRQLNTGSVFHDTWQIAMVCRRGTAQLYLSFGRDYEETTLHVVGQDGSAFVDLRRNTVAFTGSTRYLEPVDHMANTARAAILTTGQALGTLARYGAGFFGLQPAGDIFSTGIRNSITDFYARLSAGEPPAVGLNEAAEVIRACEVIGREGARGV
jgi:predicted dehydrogenase